jgi:hypothetical protein
MVLHGTLEVKPPGESKRQVGDEVKVPVDPRTTTRQPISIMVGVPSSHRLQSSPMESPSPHAKLGHHRSSWSPFVRSVMPVTTCDLAVSRVDTARSLDQKRNQ